MSTRMRAIARNVRYRMTFNTTTNRYTVERESAPGTFVAEGGAQPLPSGVRFGTVTSTPIFDTRGMLAAQVSVPIQATGHPTKTITINVLGTTTIS